MPTIVSYRSATQLVMPTESNHFPIHLGEVDGRHYLSVPDEFDIPPAQAEDTGYVIHDKPLDPEIVKRLMAVREINTACVAAIRARYSVDDELGAIRTGDKAVTDFIAECVAAAKAKKVALGLERAAAGVSP